MMEEDKKSKGLIDKEYIKDYNKYEWKGTIYDNI